jgi:hypothetical protein
MLYRSVSGMTPSTPSTDVLIPFDLSQSSTDIDVNTGLGRKLVNLILVSKLLCQTTERRL